MASKYFYITKLLPLRYNAFLFFINPNYFPHVFYIVAAESGYLFLIFWGTNDFYHFLIRFFGEIFFSDYHIVTFFLYENKIDSWYRQAVLFASNCHICFSPVYCRCCFKMRIHYLLISIYFLCGNACLS